MVDLTRIDEIFSGLVEDLFSDTENVHERIIARKKSIENT